MESLRFSRRGAGPSLVLIHGLGSSRAAWDPVVPQLAERFDVIAPDLPGFGESEALGPGDEPHPGRLAAAVADLLDELHIDRPHLVGNSVGGWVSLELAALRPVSSVTLLSPAGLWPRGVPLYSLASLRITRWASLHAAGLLSRLVAHRVGRILVLGQTHGRPTHVTPDQARASIEAIRTARGFDAALAATVHRHYSAAAPSVHRSPSRSGRGICCCFPASPATWNSCPPARAPRRYPAAATSPCSTAPPPW